MQNVESSVCQNIDRQILKKSCWFVRMGEEDDVWLRGRMVCSFVWRAWPEGSRGYIRDWPCKVGSFRSRDQRQQQQQFTPSRWVALVWPTNFFTIFYEPRRNFFTVENNSMLNFSSEILFNWKLNLLNQFLKLDINSFVTDMSNPHSKK